jgi:diaminohydroxyphosphoribosylaminopyrimidine deaminase/5-amino-6-(5-phosphoribosylamino)uracil reductase
MENYIKHMHKCLELAQLAQGETSPNPMVGCVVLNLQGEVISTGYHKKYGQYHAERDALLKLENAKDCTLVVNLEPCSHYGKTPPCTEIIIQKGIKTVVYGMKDPNPIVAGKGLQQLRDAGIEVIGPILEDECKKLNEVFVTNHTQKRTFVAIKTATTIDGKISTYNGSSKWITSKNARNEVKNIRAKYDAILTSSATILADNPTMLHKKKVILDRTLKTDFGAKIYQQGEIIVFCETLPKKNNEHENIIFVQTPVNNNRLDIDFILKKLYEMKIMSVLVEAGGTLNGSFLPYVNKLYHFVAPKVLGDNSGKSCFDTNNVVNRISECSELKFESFQAFEPDVLLIYSTKKTLD